MRRPEPCTHPSHLDPALKGLGTFEWTCPRCHAKTEILVVELPEPDPVPAIVGA